MVSRRLAQRVAAEIDEQVDVVTAVVGALHDVLQAGSDESGLARLRTIGREAQRRTTQAVADELEASFDTVSRVLGGFLAATAPAEGRGAAEDIVAVEDPVEPASREPVPERSRQQPGAAKQATGRSRPAGTGRPGKQATADSAAPAPATAKKSTAPPARGRSPER